MEKYGSFDLQKFKKSADGTFSLAMTPEREIVAINTIQTTVPVTGSVKVMAHLGSLDAKKAMEMFQTSNPGEVAGIVNGYDAGGVVKLTRTLRQPN